MRRPTDGASRTEQDRGDLDAGLHRIRAGRAFRYVDHHQRPVRDAATLKRIQSLAIPPGYEQVWISPSPNSHLQATGVDARGRKQYRYHAQWRAQREEAKFEHIIGFARALPQLRRRVEVDLARRGLPREKVLATTVALLDSTLIRVGNDTYARSNGHYGLTTLLDRHVRVSGRRIEFHFVGKSGVERRVEIEDRRLSRLVRRLSELPRHHLFQYFDEDHVAHRIHSDEVNDYLKRTAGPDFSAKDFRTWAGTVACALTLATTDANSPAPTKVHVLAAVKTVAQRLGNTPAVCRKSYIHPLVIDEYLNNGLAELRRSALPRGDLSGGLHAGEPLVLRFLERARRRSRRA